MKTIPADKLRTYELSRVLVSAATEYDKSQSTKPGHNPYALPQYFAAIDQVEKDHFDNGLTIREALVRNFTGRLLDVMLKAVGLPKSTREEQI